LATNSNKSAALPGFFAEAYWNYGWLGIVILMIPLGAVLGLMTRYTEWVFREGRWIYFPVVLLGLKVGFRADGSLVSDVAGTAVFMVALHIAILFAERMVTDLNKR
jgi:hypothetical protein